METILGILFVFGVVCIVGMILLQEGKGGGIAAIGGAGMDNIVGARNPLRRLTVIFSIVCVLLIFAISYIINTSKKATIAEGFKTEATATEAQPEAAAPATPAAAAENKAAPAPAEAAKDSPAQPEAGNKSGTETKQKAE